MLKKLVILGGIVLALYLVLHLTTLVTGGGKSTAKPRPSATRTVAPTPSPTPTPTPVPTRPPRPTPPPVTASGEGTAPSGVFRLEGDYRYSFSLGGNCEYFGYLKSTDGFYNNLDMYQEQGPTSGGRRLRGVPPGTYYAGVGLGATSVPPCPWTITFTPE